MSIEKLIEKWRRRARFDCDPANGTTVIQMRGRAIADCATQLEAELPAIRAEQAELVKAAEEAALREGHNQAAAIVDKKADYYDDLAEKESILEHHRKASILRDVRELLREINNSILALIPEGGHLERAIARAVFEESKWWADRDSDQSIDSPGALRLAANRAAAEGGEND